MKLKIEIELDDFQADLLKRQIIDRVGVSLPLYKTKEISKKVFASAVKNQLVDNNMAAYAKNSAECQMESSSTL